MSDTPGTKALLKTMRTQGPITREDYIGTNWAGLDVSNWSFEDEAELPEELQDWTLFEAKGGKLVYKGPTLVT